MPVLILYLCIAAARDTEEKFKSPSGKKVGMKIPSYTAGTNCVSSTEES